MNKVGLLLLTLLVLKECECEKYYKLKLGELEGVSVYDDNNNSLYGVVLPKHISYEQFVK